MHALVFIFVFSWGKPLGFIRFQERFITPPNQDSRSYQGKDSGVLPPTRGPQTSTSSTTL